jgi:hypothetical protein
MIFGKLMVQFFHVPVTDMLVLMNLVVIFNNIVKKL